MDSFVNSFERAWSGFLSFMIDTKTFNAGNWWLWEYLFNMTLLLSGFCMVTTLLFFVSGRSYRKNGDRIRYACGDPTKLYVLSANAMMFKDRSEKAVFLFVGIVPFLLILMAFPLWAQIVVAIAIIYLLLESEMLKMPKIGVRGVELP